MYAICWSVNIKSRRAMQQRVLLPVGLSDGLSLHGVIGWGLLFDLILSDTWYGGPIESEPLSGAGPC